MALTLTTFWAALLDATPMLLEFDITPLEAVLVLLAERVAAPLKMALLFPTEIPVLICFRSVRATVWRLDVEPDWVAVRVAVPGFTVLPEEIAPVLARPEPLFWAAVVALFVCCALLVPWARLAGAGVCCRAVLPFPTVMGD